jgi:hypothetical protein
MKTALFTAFLMLTLTVYASGEQMPRLSPRYAQAVLPTPVFNTPEVSSVFGTRYMKTAHAHEAGLLRELEFIALPDTVLSIEAVIRMGETTVYRVATDEYPYPSTDGYYVDCRFVRTCEVKPPDRAKRLPDKDAIIASLIAAEGSAYLWGGNLREGIPQLLIFYPPSRSLTPAEHGRWILQGLDCSGLLYQATGGCTPRNTSSLVTFGKPVPIANLSGPQIIQAIEPLDIIVWPGHVIIVLDRDRVIESRPDYDATQAGNQGGVRIRKIGEALSEIMKDRVPVHNFDRAGSAVQKQFVIRRWYPHISRQ